MSFYRYHASKSRSTLPGLWSPHVQNTAKLRLCIQRLRGKSAPAAQALVKSLFEACPEPLHIIRPDSTVALTTSLFGSLMVHFDPHLSQLRMILWGDDHILDRTSVQIPSFSAKVSTCGSISPDLLEKSLRDLSQLHLSLASRVSWKAWLLPLADILLPTSAHTSMCSDWTYESMIWGRLSSCQILCNSPPLLMINNWILL